MRELFGRRFDLRQVDFEAAAVAWLQVYNAPQNRFWKSLMNSGGRTKARTVTRKPSITVAAKRLATDASVTPSAVVRTGTRANPAGAAEATGAARRTTCTGRGPKLGAAVAAGGEVPTGTPRDSSRTWFDHAAPSHHR